MTYNNAPDLKIKLIGKFAKLPTKGTKYSACWDIYSSNEKDIAIPNMGLFYVPTGLQMEIPIGWEVVIRPRSGFSNKNLTTILNSPGTIDSDYRYQTYSNGEVTPSLVSIPVFNFNTMPLFIKPQTRVAQMALKPVFDYDIVEADIIERLNTRNGGFGSTG